MIQQAPGLSPGRRCANRLRLSQTTVSLFQARSHAELLQGQKSLLFGQAAGVGNAKPLKKQLLNQWDFSGRCATRSSTTSLRQASEALRGRENESNNLAKAALGSRSFRQEDDLDFRNFPSRLCCLAYVSV
jgi:hypothetical protein